MSLRMLSLWDAENITSEVQEGQGIIDKTTSRLVLMQR